VFAKFDLDSFSARSITVAVRIPAP
jgi:hypothetical protein